MTFDYSAGKALNLGFFGIFVVALARYFFVLPMAYLLLLAALYHFVAGVILRNVASENLLIKTAFLAAPFFLTGAILVYLMMANIFYLLPLAAPVSAFFGFFVRAKWRTSGAIFVAPVVVLWAVLTGIGFQSITPRALSHDFDVELDEPAPAFSAQTLDGQRISSEQFAGKVTLIDFWGTWCAPCLRQFPELQEIYERYKDHPEVGILILNTGQSGDDPAKIRRFLEVHPYTFPVAHDDNSVSKDFGITSLPHVILIDKKGKIRMRHTGLMQEKGSLKAGLQQRIEELLQED